MRVFKIMTVPEDLAALYSARPDNFQRRRVSSRLALSSTGLGENSHHGGLESVWIGTYQLLRGNCDSFNPVGHRSRTSDLAFPNTIM